MINPPYCAWRFVGNHDAWNVAFPDMRSMYHVMQMNMGKEGGHACLLGCPFVCACDSMRLKALGACITQLSTDPGDEFKIVAESFPYARYMSYQVRNKSTAQHIARITKAQHSTAQHIACMYVRVPCHTCPPTH